MFMNEISHFPSISLFTPFYSEIYELPSRPLMDLKKLRFPNRSLQINLVYCCLVHLPHSPPLPFAFSIFFSNYHVVILTEFVDFRNCFYCLIPLQRFLNIQTFLKPKYSGKQDSFWINKLYYSACLLSFLEVVNQYEK